MALSSTKPDVWTLSPQMTAAPELWRGCILCVPMWEGVGRPRDIGPFSADITGEASDSVVPFVLGERGMATDYQQLTFPSSNLQAEDLDAFSVQESGDDSGALIVFDSRNNNDSQHILGKNNEWAFQVWSDGGLRWATYGGNSGASDQISLGFHSAAHSGTAGTGGDIYLDGQLYKSHTNSDTSGNDTTPVRIGSKAANSDIFDGHIYMVALWDRILTNDEMKTLTTDPFAMLRPAGF